MTALTWRQVAAPDFSSGATLLNTANAAMQRALSGAQTGLEDWQKARMVQAEDQIAQQVSQFQTPEAYRNALASGAVLGNVDQGLIGKKLLDFAAGQEQVVANRERQGAQYKVPAIEAMIRDAALSGNEAGIAEILKNPEYARALQVTNHDFNNPMKVQGLLEGVRDTEARKNAPYIENAIAAALSAGAVDNAQAARSNNLDALKRANSPMFSQTAFDDAVNKDWFDKLASAVKGKTLQGDQLKILQEAEKTANKQQLNMLYRAFPNMNSRETLLAAGQESSPVSPEVASSLGLTPDTDPNSAANTVLGNGKWKTPSLNGRMLTQLTMGELEPVQKELINATRGRTDIYPELSKDEGSSALGKYQITRDTMRNLAPRVFGPNWKDVPFTDENQDKLGEQRFKDAVKSGVSLEKVWVGLGRGNLKGKYSGKPNNLDWETVKKDIFASESKKDRQYTRQDANAASVLAGAVNESTASQIGATPDLTYISDSVTKIDNSDFAGAYKYYLEKSGIPDKKFNQRQFMDLYAQYGKVESEASKLPRKDKPNSAPTYETVPLGQFALALAKSTKNNPSFGSTSDKPLDGKLLTRVFGEFDSNAYFYNSKELQNQLAIAAGATPYLAKQNQKAAKERAASAELTPEKLDKLAADARMWRMMSDNKPTDTALKRRAEEAEAASQAAIEASVEKNKDRMSQALGR